MKKLIIVSLLYFSLVGCAQLSEWTQAQADCASDPTCLAETKKYAELGRTIGNSVYPVAGTAAAGVITYLALGIFGLRKKKKEEPK
jgi:hypothetical protein